MAEKCLVFVYGLLKPGIQPPRSMSQSWADDIEGVLYDLGEFPAAVQVGAAGSRITGYTIEIDTDELTALDEFEDTETGVYRRIMVETGLGHFAWVYEYIQPIPPGTPVITSWSR
jgi:gamma-glutamylcyclotransferase (GGCT)/AIG2-like uncharacterized protein YtfP